VKVRIGQVGFQVKVRLPRAFQDVLLHRLLQKPKQQPSDYRKGNENHLAAMT
jgi:hypothetical protein